MEVIRAVEEVTGRKVPSVVGPRREGDAARLVASSAKLERQLGWRRNFSDLRTIVAHAWNFAERRHGVRRSTARLPPTA
jgi:UDP-glucose 4-epimerase